MDIVFDHTNHVKMWTWLAENPEREKKEWTEWRLNGGTIERTICNCFACDYDDYFDDEMCVNCPLIWSTKECFANKKGLFYKWENAKYPKVKTRLALQIANLPVKTGVICK